MKFLLSEEWMDDAVCAGAPAEVFFPPTSEDKDRAMQYCGVCAVQSECLTYALVNRIDYGIWGGNTEKERRKYRKQQAQGNLAN